MSSRSEGSLTVKDHAFREELVTKRLGCQVISIDTLPDDALLAIFDHCMHYGTFKATQDTWQSLVHVCHRWRRIVFQFPHHLDLRLVCIGQTPARDTLDVWPAFPLIILCNKDYPVRSVDNIVAVLERSDRVCQIHLENVHSSDMEILFAAMQQPFPELTRLSLWAGEMPVIPDSFLGRSAPRLVRVTLEGIPFPGLPKLLLSATHLVHLYLRDIPHPGYFSPDALVTALSTLTSLSHLQLGFLSPRSCPDQASRRPPPSTRSVLPVLMEFTFKGVSEYLEDLVACIDAPRLDHLNITFFNDIEFDTPQLVQFISRTPMSTALESAHITLSDCAACVKFSDSSLTSHYKDLRVEILCKGLDWQLSSLEQVCTSCLPPLYMSEDLYLYEKPDSQPDWKCDIDNGVWLGLLRPFIAVTNLYLSKEIASCIVLDLQDLVEGRTTEVLPVLQYIFLEGLESSGPVQKGIGQFVAARQVVGHSIAVARWTNKEQDVQESDDFIVGDDLSVEDDFEDDSEDGSEEDSEDGSEDDSEDSSEDDFGDYSQYELQDEFGDDFEGDEDDFEDDQEI